MGVLGRYLDRGWFHSHPSFRGWVRGVKHWWNRCSSNFRFQNKFIIVLLCGLLVDNNTFLIMSIFKISYWLHWWWCLWKPKCIRCNNNDDNDYDDNNNNNNNNNKGNEELLLLLLLGAELPLMVESFSLLNDLFPFPSILDAGYQVFNLHLANILFDIILPSILGSSLWSFG